MKSSGSRQIAERYVTALFDVSAKDRAKVERDLSTLHMILAESEELQNLLSNPLLSREQQAKAMESVLKAIKSHAVTKQFITLLARQKRLALLPEIIVLFARRMSEARGEMKAELVSAAPLKKQDAEAISDRLSQAYGKKVVLELRQDPELLGGIVVKVGSVQLDASLSGKLRRLGHKLRAA